MAKPNIIWDAICDLWAMKPVTKSDNTRMGKLFWDFTLKPIFLAERSWRL
ncbi:hypothetical protein LCGC14_2810340 [marine sediment metagenome]|uniref:Uncharacterized protein n=1 Tax=marine sediment metagenome TaxID=412755 RepID=A0A0F8Z6V1_9ZZZZ